MSGIWEARHTDEQRADACRLILATHHSVLAEDVDAEWIEPLRQNTTRLTTDAAADLVRHLGPNLDHAIRVLEHVTTIDPYNETHYQKLIRLQHRLGRSEAAKRTLDALTTRLAEIDAQPALDTISLATRKPTSPTPTQTAPRSRVPD